MRDRFRLAERVRDALALHHAVRLGNAQPVDVGVADDVGLGERVDLIVSVRHRLRLAQPARLPHTVRDGVHVAQPLELTRAADGFVERVIVAERE